jgi:beta-galactosidase
MFDLGSDSRQEGEKTGVNDKGLVTADRKTAKDAFYLYKCNWNPEPELRIVGQRRTTTTNETSSVVVFSNAGEVSFMLNGKPYGVLTPDAVMCCVWRDVPLKPGANELVLTSGGLTRRAVWTRLVP